MTPSLLHEPHLPRAELTLTPCTQKSSRLASCNVYISITSPVKRFKSRISASFRPSLGRKTVSPAIRVLPVPIVYGAPKRMSSAPSERSRTAGRNSKSFFCSQSLWRENEFFDRPLLRSEGRPHEHAAVPLDIERHRLAAAAPYLVCNGLHINNYTTNYGEKQLFRRASLDVLPRNVLYSDHGTFAFKKI